MQWRVGLLYACTILVLLTGCTTSAKREVRALVDSEQSRLSEASSRVQDTDLKEYLDSLAEPILAAACELDGTHEEDFRPDPNLEIHDEYEIILVHDPFPNGWTHGDDFACITTSAFLEAKHPGEIAFIIAHEYGHIRDLHLVEAVERRKGNEFAAGVVLVLGAAAAGAASAYDPYADTSEMIQNTVNAASSIRASFSPHRQRDEYEADAQAIELMAAAGYPLHHCTEWFDRMLELYGDSEGSVSHPPTSKRRQRVQDAIDELGDYVPHRFLDGDQFRQMQDRLRVITLNAAREESLTFYTTETYDRAVRGLDTPHAKSCGPLDAELGRVFDAYTDAVLSND